MDNNRHITQPPMDSPWTSKICGLLMFLLWSFVSTGIGTLWGSILSWIAMVVIGSVLLALLSHYFLFGDIILTQEGIHRKRRLKTKDIPWSSIIHAIAMDYSNTKVLILVKTGGYKLTEKCSKGWFFFRNPVSTIFLPDDQFTRRFVTEYYGPLDFDLSANSGNHSKAND